MDPEEIQKAPPNPEGEAREAPSDPGVETNDVAGLEEESRDLEGLVLPARRNLTISGNLSPDNVNAHVESRGELRREKSSVAKVPADERGRRRRECVNVRRWGHDNFSEEIGATGADSEGHDSGAVNQQKKAMNALEMEEWRNLRRRKKCNVARPNDKLVVGHG